MTRGIFSIIVTAAVAIGPLGLWPVEVHGQVDPSTCVDFSLDVQNDTPLKRAERVLGLREGWAEVEFDASLDTCQDGSAIEHATSASTFHKTLPHNELGEVAAADFYSLTDCVADGKFETCERVAQGDPDGRLANPLAGYTVGMAGPSSTALSTPAAPPLNSPEFAVQLAEVYWMALTRDVPFSKYGEDSNTIAAAANLASMPGYASMPGAPAGPSVDPQTQLFRSSFVGVETGPMISQLLVSDFSFDSLDVTPKQTTFVGDVDYMTDYDSWLHIQNGGSGISAELDSTKRLIRNGRDLARLVSSDVIYTEAFRGALVLLAQGAISGGGVNGPYTGSTRQEGFVNFGVSGLMRTFASLELSQKSSWYQKWNVHLFARPEATAGTLHNALNGLLHQEFDPSLMDNTELLDRVAARNGAQNQKRHGTYEETYMLSQATPKGSPTHPSYPAGHAVQNGAFATVLKAFVGLDRGEACFSSPGFPDDEGADLLPWDGECLTYNGEINKLAVNVAYGRQIMGVHYRFDSHEGLILGEIIAIRTLQQDLEGFPENGFYEFRLFTGQTIRLDHDGSFSIDGQLCPGVAFKGVVDCIGEVAGVEDDDVVDDPAVSFSFSFSSSVSP